MPLIVALLWFCLLQSGILVFRELQLFQYLNVYLEFKRRCKSRFSAALVGYKNCNISCFLQNNFLRSFRMQTIFFLVKFRCVIYMCKPMAYSLIKNFKASSITFAGFIGVLLTAISLIALNDVIKPFCPLN